MASLFDRLRIALKRTSEYIAMTAPWERTARWFPHDFENLVEEGYQKSELVFACLQLIANCASEATMRVYNAAGDALDKHPLRALLMRPCPGLKMSEYDFWELTLLMMHLAGVAYWEKERAARGNVVALWPLRPDTVKVVPGIRGIDHYEVGVERAVVPDADMLRFAFTNPLSPFDAQSPLAVAARQVNVDIDLQSYIKLLFQNNTVPQGVLTTEQYLVDTEADALAERWEKRQGGNRRGRVAVLGKGATYQEIGSRLENIDSTNLHQLSETRICMAMGVPPILIGALAGLEKATYSNYEQAEVQFWHSKVLPLWKKLSDQMDEELAPDFGSGLSCRWDLTGVWALQREEQAKREFALKELQAGVATVNEFRAVAGREDVPAGDVLLWPAGVKPQPAAEKYERPEPQPVPPQLARGENGDEEAEPAKAAKQFAAGIVEPIEEYLDEAREWERTPLWMQTAAQRYTKSLRELDEAFRWQSYNAILSISDDAWRAASEGKALDAPDQTERK